MEQDEFLNAQDAAPRAMIADQDRPHIWQFNGVYELPFGRSQTAGRDIGSALNRLVGGWQFNWNFKLRNDRGAAGIGLLPAEHTAGRQVVVLKQRTTINAELAEPAEKNWFCSASSASSALNVVAGTVSRTCS
jgi:hypothetical protein